jgi:hypothetical protein
MGPPNNSLERTRPQRDFMCDVGMLRRSSRGRWAAIYIPLTIENPSASDHPLNASIRPTSAPLIGRRASRLHFPRLARALAESRLVPPPPGTQKARHSLQPWRVVSGPLALARSSRARIGRVFSGKALKRGAAQRLDGAGPASCGESPLAPRLWRTDCRMRQEATGVPAEGRADNLWYAVADPS